MPDLIPVDNDPFDVPAPGIPVDHDPFQPQQLAPPSGLAQQVAGFPQRAAALGMAALGPIGEAGMTVGDWMRTGQVDPRDIPQVAGGVMMGVAAPEAEEAVPLETLAMDAASRLKRAGAMGFRTGMPLYHGNGETFSSFRAVPTTQADMTTPGVSLALDPEVANEFASASARANPQVYPLLHRTDNPAILTLDGSETHGEVVGALRDAFDAGHDAVMLKNYTTPSGQSGKNIIIVRDANQLRSPSAAFDPKQKFSPDLLASIGGISMLPAATIGLQAVDYDPFSGNSIMKTTR